MWLDICTISLRKHQWRATPYNSQSSEEYFLASTTLEKVSGYLGRYIRGLQFGSIQDYCKIIITPTTAKGGVGCRMIGTVLHQLAARYGGIEHFPMNLYFQADESQFQLRSLITLFYLCTAERRRSIYDNYFFTHIPANRLEKASDYEKRVIEIMHYQFPEHQRLDANDLKIEKVQSTPDGLFLSSAKRELLIIEAKKNKRDFADGTAQIVQYYAQARNHPIFQDLVVKTCLVTADDESTEAYNVWQELMISKKEMKIVVDSSNAKGVAA